MIGSYSPNIRWGQQVVEVVLMMWGYKVTRQVKVGGNCRGFDVIECAADMIYEDCGGTLKMTDATGKELIYEDDEGREERWIKDMIVSAQIIDWEPPTVNEVRRMNGAKPIKDGNRPWEPL